MPIYRFGFVVKSRREAMGVTQEELAEGICAVPTLSRIENGERRPTKENFEMLLQRLGFSDSILDEYVDEKTMLLHDLKFRIRHAMMNKNLQEAACLLEEYKAKSDPKSRIDRQFVEAYSVLTNPGKYQIQDELGLLEKALKLTHPNYQEDKLPRLLSYEEIIILNNIALCNLRTQEYGRAEVIFFHLKTFYERFVVNMEEVLRTQPMILYNLSKCLGLAGKYSECIEICDAGIKIARETGRCVQLSQTLYNRAWSLVKRGMPGDQEEALESVKQALCMALAMKDQASIKHYSKFIHDNFMESYHWITTVSG